MNGDHIQEKISNQDILSYPFKSMYILLYIHARYPCSYPCKISMFISAKVIPCISCYIFFTQVQYPGKISLLISKYDFLTISKYIHYRYQYQISLVLSYLIFLKCSSYPYPVSREIIHDDIQL
jgi:hypothetical protein